MASSKSKSAEAQKLIESCGRASFFPSSIWWKGPGAGRPSAEPDQYGVLQKRDEKAWVDQGRALLFGPAQKTKSNPYPIWSHTIVKQQDRFNETHEPSHAKTQPDQYNVRLKDTFMNDTRGAQRFRRTNSVQELKRKIKYNTVFRSFNKDFSRSGSCLAF